jgi:hypothetical protein
LRRDANVKKGARKTAFQLKRISSYCSCAEGTIASQAAFSCGAASDLDPKAKRREKTKRRTTLTDRLPRRPPFAPAEAGTPQTSVHRAAKVPAKFMPAPAGIARRENLTTGATCPKIKKVQ